MTIIGRTGLHAILLAGLAVSVVVHGAQISAPADDDLVVVGRKLRTVRIHYQRQGQRLARCEVTQSSGKPAIDHLMCAFVRSCVANGFTSPRRAMACVNERIDRLATDSPDAVPEIPTAEPVPATVDSDEIVVVASRPVVLSGYWTFIQTGHYKSSYSDTPLPARRWKMCIRDGETGRAIDHILRIGSASSVQKSLPPAACRRWKIGIEGKNVTGSRNCFVDRSRTTGELIGYLGDDIVQLTRTYRSLGPGFRASGWSDIVGTRTGRCG